MKKKELKNIETENGARRVSNGYRQTVIDIFSFFGCFGLNTIFVLKIFKVLFINEHAFLVISAMLALSLGTIIKYFVRDLETIK